VKTAIGSVLAAAGASICCIGPVLLSALGAGALGAAAAQFEAYRPMLLTITVALLGAAFYTTYRPSATESCGVDGTCRPASRRVAKIGLWLATLLVILLVAFPYYVGIFV
jgi:mercuric ion transport protein